MARQEFKTPQDALAHYGVKGMHWGVRKQEETGSKPAGEVVLTKECKNGTTLTVTKRPPGRYDSWLASKSQSYREDLELMHNFDFTDKSGTRVGTATFVRSSETKLDLEWIGVKRAHRSNGYARAALEGVIEYSKTNGITELHLMASKMGRPLYEKLGFVEQPDGTHILHVPAEAQHQTAVDSLADFITKAIDNDPELDALAHYGVKGMHWGERKAEEKGSGRSSKPQEMSKDELHKAIDTVFNKEDPAVLKAEAQAKLKAQAEDPGFPKRDAKAKKVEAQAAKYDETASRLAERRDNIQGNNLWNKYERKTYNDQVGVNEKNRDALLKRADQIREGKLTDRQKVLIGLGAAAAVTGLAVYGNQKYKQHQAGLTSASAKKLAEENRQKTADEWDTLFGHRPDFETASSYSSATGKSFYSGFASGRAATRPEFTIPKETVFQRLSNHPEDSTEYGKMKGAYATFLHNDKKLYGTSGEFGHKAYTIHFQAKDDVRVPTMSTVLAHLKQVKASEGSTQTTPEHIMYEYRQLVGGDWSGPTALKLFSSLKSFGYSAIVDDMDAGYMSDLPVVFFGDSHPATATPRTQVDRTRDANGLLKISNIHA